MIAGVMWIGHLYFFNFVNIRFAAAMKEAGVGKTTVPELMPRALYWFRWGAAWTWLTGVLLLMLGIVGFTPSVISTHLRGVQRFDPQL